MKRALLGFVLGLAAFLLTAEAMMRLLPVSTATRAGYHIDPKILTYAPRHAWRYSTGWDLRHPQHLVTNSHGFVADHDFVRNPDAVALIGDSFVESASLDADNRPAAQLERQLGSVRRVYAMGAAGTSLLDYAERIRFAHEQFGVRDFVVMLERGDVLQALCGSGNVASQCLDPQTLQPRTVLTPPPSLLKRVLRESALAQYFVSQLKVDPQRLVKQMFTRGAPEQVSLSSAAPTQTRPAVNLRAVDAVAAEFFARTQPLVSGRLVLVLDADRQSLMQGRRPDDPVRRRFTELARTAGAQMVDLEPVFAAHFATSRMALDLGPQDGHFNPLATRLVAAAIAQELRVEHAP